jgi:hypothetical protein
MNQLTFSEHLTLNQLTKIASQTVSKVLKENADKGEPGRWKGLSTQDHIHHAVVHLYDRLDDKEAVVKEDVEHALTRLAMALALWEK